MLDMRPNCEICDKDLPADSLETGVNQALICSFECTFCKGCAENFTGAESGPRGHGQGAKIGLCPNCGGALFPRPSRRGEALTRHPASKQRVRAKTKAKPG